MDHSTVVRNNMIIVRLIGGLGNQMFQYAIGRHLSCMHNVPLKVDITGFNDYDLRTYRLGHFAIHADIASVPEIEHVRFRSRTGVLLSLGTLAGHFVPYYRRNIYREPHFPYDPHILKCKNDVYLEGYWQSEKYFKDIEHLIRSEFTPVTEPDNSNKKMADQIRSCESVSLHVRRGDYVSNPVTNAYHGTCSHDYYQTAIRIIEKKIKEPHFFMFSDDPAWVRENIDVRHPMTIVDLNGPDKDYEDMRLMSLCQYHIIANSSFSWWGAWLSDNPEKIVITPKKWFNDPQIDTIDLIPESWIRL
jgi:hypothetical protein